MSDLHIENSQKLSPDAQIILYELTTTTGASVFFKNGPDVTYLGDDYLGLPVSMSSEKRSVDNSPERPTLTIGGDNVDFGSIKPALFSGHVDGGTLQKHIVELEDLKANLNQKITTTYRVKQVQSYSRFQISLVLARFSPSSQTTIPYRKYTRPAFPHVQF